MALVLSEEQQFIRDSAKDFVNSKSPVEALRDLRDSKDATGYNEALWREMGEMGWAGLIIPEQYGGVGYGFMELGQILEETGRTLCASPLLSSTLSASLLLRIASEKQKEGWLPSMASGETTCTIAFDEISRHAPEQISTVAAKTDEGFVLNGAKCGVIDGHIADYILVPAKMDDQVAIFALPKGQEGMEVTRVIMSDSRNSARIKLVNCKVSEAHLVGSGKSGEDLAAVLDIARICISAEMLGTMTEAYERTISYLKERRQFGVPIGSFQALQHRAAEMYCEIDLCRSSVMAGLEALDLGTEMVPILASLTKAKVSTTIENVSSEGVQLFGGIGMTDDEEIGFFLKRARVAQQLFGDYYFHIDRYASLIGY